MGYSERTAEALFGAPKRDESANRSLFDSAYERVKANFAGAEVETLDPESYGEAVFTYDPTRSSNPPRPRTLRAGWVRPQGAPNGTVVVQFREGAVYEYYNVPYNVWRNFRRVQSPGKAMNRAKGLVGGGYAYRRVYG